MSLDQCLKSTGGSLRCFLNPSLLFSPYQSLFRYYQAEDLFDDWQPVEMLGERKTRCIIQIGTTYQAGGFPPRPMGP
jgi:hypothetical protein